MDYVTHHAFTWGMNHPTPFASTISLITRTCDGLGQTSCLHPRSEVLDSICLHHWLSHNTYMSWTRSHIIAFTHCCEAPNSDCLHHVSQNPYLWWTRSHIMPSLAVVKHPTPMKCINYKNNLEFCIIIILYT